MSETTFVNVAGQRLTTVLPKSSLTCDFWVRDLNLLTFGTKSKHPAKPEVCENKTLQAHTCLHE